MKTLNKGPLILVEIRTGHFAKMHREDAIARGLLPADQVHLDPVPMMEPAEIEAIKGILRDFCPKRVLEWGAGGSTLFWPELFPEIQWVTIEHDFRYAKEVQKKASPNVLLLHESYPDYYGPHPHLGKFDLIIVDGRHRVRCLDVARDLLAEGGVVLLHDAGRPKYHEAKRFYHKLEVLVPPKKSKDPRGLWMFSEPVQVSRQ